MASSPCSLAGCIRTLTGSSAPWPGNRTFRERCRPPIRTSCSIWLTVTTPA